MRFLIQDPVSDYGFSRIYKGYVFDKDPHDGVGFTSLLINDVQLEIDPEGKIMYVWGYCPIIYFEETELFPQEYSFCSLVAVLEKPLIEGVSHRFRNNEPLYVNKEKKWICVGNPQTKGKQLVQFAPGSIATMENQEIIALWLQPREFPELKIEY